MIGFSALWLIAIAAVVAFTVANDGDSTAPGVAVIATPEPTRTPRPTVEPPLHTPPTRVARPDPLGAMSIDDARRELSKNPDLASVIGAAEAGDAASLMAMAKRTPPGVCSRGRRGALPDGCVDRNDPVEGVYQDCGEVCERPLTLVQAWIELTLKHGPVRLTFAGSASSLPEGNGGKYFLAFQAAAVGDFEQDLDGIFLVVNPGQQGPIEVVTFMSGSMGGMAGAQLYLDRTPGAMDRLKLLAPKDVSTWRDISGRTEAITVVRPEYVTPSPLPGTPPGSHSAGTKVGIPAVDVFLDKAYDGDLASLANDAIFVPVGCYDSPDRPPCDEGDLPNTPYDVVGVYNCDKHFARSVDELKAALREIDREGQQYLLFVLAPERAPGPYREAAGEYIVGMRTGSYPRRTFYLDKDGRLLTVDSCPGSYPNFAYGIPSEAIVLAPP